MKSCAARDPVTHCNRKCAAAHFLPAFAHLRLAVGADGGQQVQDGQHGARVDDHRVGRRRGGSRVGGVGQVELQVSEGFHRGGGARRAVVALSGSTGAGKRTTLT